MIFDQIITPSSKLKPWTLWTVDAHANVRGNWMRLMDGDAGPFYRISASHFWMETQEFCLSR